MMSKQKKYPGKKPWLLLCFLSVLFYGFLLFLTLIAKDVHVARLPKVTTGQPETRGFTCTFLLPDGTMQTLTRFCLALPKEMVDADKVFYLKSETEHGFTYYYAEPLSFTIDDTLEHPDYYAVSFPLYYYGSVILTGYEELSAEDEVFLVKEKQAAPDEANVPDLFQ